jgi:hypothetical protein
MTIHYSQKYVLPLALSMLVLFGAHLLAMYFNAYERYPLVDIPLHVGGGVSVALLSLFLVSFVRPVCSSRALLVVALVGALVFGVLWEGFEWVTDVWTGAGEYADLLDAYGDLVNDILGGGMVAFWYTRKK